MFRKLFCWIGYHHFSEKLYQLCPEAVYQCGYIESDIWTCPHCGKVRANSGDISRHINHVLWALMKLRGERIMIELRYLNFAETKNGFSNLYYFSVGESRGVKLQYRVRTNMLEVGLQEPIWSDWKDVEAVRV